MMKKFALLTVLIASSSTSAHAENLALYREEARAVAMPFMKRLLTENQKAISEGGHEPAIRVCRDIAPKMAGDISRQIGWKLTRVSLQVRNPLLGTADAWEQKNLQDFESRAAQDEKPESMEVAEIVQEPAGKFFRYMKAIALQPGCVACHGNSAQIADNVNARLREEYPHDKATGYSIGQIRGAVSIKRPL